MKVMCINNVDLADRLKLGKEYEVLEESMNCFRMLDEKGIFYWYDKKMFVVKKQEEEVDELDLKQDMIDFLIKENKNLKNKIDLAIKSSDLVILCITKILERVPKPIRYIVGVGELTKNLSEYIKKQD